MLIIGLPGSGKSMLARRLAGELGAALVEGDAHLDRARLREAARAMAEMAGPWVYEGRIRVAEDLVVPRITHLIRITRPATSCLRRLAARELALACRRERSPRQAGARLWHFARHWREQLAAYDEIERAARRTPGCRVLRVQEPSTVTYASLA